MGDINTSPLPKPSSQNQRIADLGGTVISASPVSEMSPSTSSATQVISSLEIAIKSGVFEDLREPHDKSIGK